MDVVLGLSMTATAGRVVVVEGERADGVTIEIEAFDTIAPEGIPQPSPVEQVPKWSPPPPYVPRGRDDGREPW